MKGRGVAMRAIWIFVAALSWLLVGRGVAALEEEADAVVVGADSGRPMSGGGSETAFTLRLPDNAACPGDSEDGQYRVQGFMVPESADPGSLEYRGIRPAVEHGYPLYMLSTDSYDNQSTDKASEPGGEGPILDLPAFSFAVFEPGRLPTGRYHIGIACTLWSETQRYWATEIELREDDDDPAGFSWSALDPPTETGSGGTDLPGAALMAAVAGGGVGLFYLTRRRSSRARPSTVHR